MIQKHKKGKLTVIAGPMFAGKTTKLLAIYDILTKLGYGVLCFKSEVDGDGGIGHTNSHDERPLPVIFINPKHPEKILRHVSEDGVKKIIIDAVHFFPKPEIKKVINKLMTWGVDVYVNGLIYDYRKKEFGATKNLLARADEKYILYSVCVKCGAKASNTERIKGGTKQQISSKKARYIASCNSCHRIYRGG